MKAKWSSRAHQGPRGWVGDGRRVRGGTLMVVLVTMIAAGALLPGVASAQSYHGATAYWSPLTLSINGGEVTALSTRSARVPCPGQTTDVDPVSISLAAPVPITGGTFTAQGSTETDENAAATWTVTGTDRSITER